MSRPRAGFVDRALALVGLERTPAVRAQSRRYVTGGRSAMAPVGSVYAGASYNRLTEDWFASILSADQEIKGDLKRLRGAARAMARDNAMASRYLEMLAENVIGPTGIRMQAEARTGRGGLHKALNDKIEAAWREWGRPANASANGLMSWVDIQDAAIVDMARDGEFLAREIVGADNPFHYAIQHLDADQLDHEYNVARGRSETGNEIRMGVEINRFGMPVAYWIWADHPSDPRQGQSRQRFPASEIIHLYRARRAGQTRGVPWLAPAMLDAQMLEKYEEAEVTAARIGASNMAAVAFDPDKAAGDASAPAGEDQIPMELEPGLMMRLRPGETLVNTNFNHPNTAFGSFIKDVKRKIATAWNVAYTSLTGDLEAVNYSSIRAGLLSERDFYRKLHVWLPERLHARVYAHWAPLAALGGFFSAADARGTETITWQPRGWKWVDPVNDLQAASLAIQLGVSSRTEIAAEQGKDFEEVIDQISDEEAYAKAAKVSVTPPGTKAAPGAAPANDSTDTSNAPPDNSGDDSSTIPIRRAAR